MIFSLARREWQAALATRWFWFYCGAAGLLGSGFIWVAAGLIPAGVPAEAAGGRMLVSTASLLALLAPLMGLTAGANSLAGERDRRTLDYLLALPVTRSEVLIGKLAGNALALGAALAGSGALMTVTAAVLGFPLPAPALAVMTGLAWLLATASLALGSVLAAGPAGLAAVQGTVLITWLLMVLLGDLGIMGLLMISKLPAPALLALVFLNPVHQFRVAAVAVFSPTLEILGPAGLYAGHRLGGALVPALVTSQIAWIAAAVLVALERFRRGRAG